MVRKLRIACITGLALLTTGAPAGVDFTCSDEILRDVRGPFAITKTVREYLAIDGIPITGDYFYPYRAILEALRITDADLKKYQNARVISLAEGFSTLLPFLVGHLSVGWGTALSPANPFPNPHAKALDRWYFTEIPHEGYGDDMRSFVDVYREHLIQGNVLQMPIPDESYDFMLAHRLIDNISDAHARQAMQEAVRTLAVGGEARFANIPPARSPALEAFVNTRFAGYAVASTQRVFVQFTIDREAPAYDDADLITIRKLKSHRD